MLLFSYYNFLYIEKNDIHRVIIMNFHFQIILLAFLVSVVWSTVQATYIFEDNHDYSVLNTDRLGSFHEPLYHSHLSQLDFTDDHDGIVLSDLTSHGLQLPHNLRNTFNRPEVSSDGWKPVFRNQDAHKIGAPYQNEQHKQTYGSLRTSQEQTEIKSTRDDHNNNYPQSNTKYLFQNDQVQTHILPEGVFREIPDKAYILSNIISQIGAGKEFSQNPQYDISTLSKSEYQQDNGNPYSKTPTDDTSVSKTKSQENYETGKNAGSSNNADDSQNNSPDHRNIQLVSGLPAYHAIEKGDKNYPVIYSQGSPRAILLQVPVGHGELYSNVQEHLGTTGTVYNLPIAHDSRYPILNTGTHIQLAHNIPHLINGNLHGTLNGQVLYELGRGSNGELGHNINFDIEDIENYNTGDNNTQNESTKNNEHSIYSSKTSDNSAVNTEQMLVDFSLKSGLGDSISYDTPREDQSSLGKKDDPSYQNNKEENVEQKSLEIGLKSSSGGKSSSTTLESDSQYKITQESNFSNYPDNGQQKSPQGVEQKPVEEDLKTSNGGYKSSDNLGSFEYSESRKSIVPKYPETNIKSSQPNVEQKQVNIEQRITPDSNSYNNLGDTASEYPGIGSIDSTKYPGSKFENSAHKTEQKSVEIKSYEEVKSSSNSYKKDLSNSGAKSSLNKEDVSYAVGEVKKYDNDQNINFKFVGYQKPGLGKNKDIGGSQHISAGQVTSNSYFRTGYSPSQNRGSYNQIQNHPRLNSYRQPSIESHRSSNNGLNYVGNRGISNIPKANNYQTGGYNSGHTFQRPHLSSQSIKPNIYFDRHISSSPHGYQRSQQSYGGPNSGSYQSNYKEIGEISAPIHSRIQSIPKDTSIPTYQDSVSGGIFKPKYSDSSDNEKRTQINHNYPSTLSIRSRSDSAKPYRPIRQNIHSPASSNYLTRRGQFLGENVYKSNAGKIDAPSKLDYTRGTESTEYPGIGEISASKLPDAKFNSYSNEGEEYSGIGEISASKSPTSKASSYPTQQKQNNIITEQKTYDTQGPVETYNGVKNGFEKSPGIEYSGIGEIGSIPSPKSQIVGGRRPIRRPSKISQIKSESSPKGVKSHSEIKSEQKYLPITATLAKSGSSLKPKPEVRDYDTSKIEQKEEPEKIEQQEEPEKIEQQELVHEAFLAGQGPQIPGHASSGYGFLRPAGGSHRPRHKDEVCLIS